MGQVEAGHASTREDLADDMAAGAEGAGVRPYRDEVLAEQEVREEEEGERC